MNLNSDSKDESMDYERISKEEFMNLSTEEICRLSLQKNLPHTGIFIADGNRRLVMTQTGLTPGSQDFYDAYLEIVTTSFMKNLEVFFLHGLHTLLFPLFGPSLLKRDDRFRLVVMPGLIHILFKSDRWLSFYREQGIRVRAYGNINLLDHHFKELKLADEIIQAEKLTSTHDRHRLFYGFFSSPAFDRAFIREMAAAVESGGHEPDLPGLADLYYGEPMKAADFFITSTRPGYLGALPPFAYDQKTRLFTLATPGVSALKDSTYREILYDVLFLEPGLNGQYPGDTDEKDIRALGDFYRRNQNLVIGTGKITGKWWTFPDEKLTDKKTPGVTG